MADAFYTEYRNSIQGAATHSFPDLNTDDIRIVLYDEGADALNLADQDLADITAGARIAVSGALASPTVGVVAAGVFDHANVTWTAVTGASVESMVYYKHTGTDSTSPLIANIDASTGLPVTPNGGDITLTVHVNGAWSI